MHREVVRDIDSESECDSGSDVSSNGYEAIQVEDLPIQKTQTKLSLIDRVITRSSTIINDIKQDNEVAKLKERESKSAIEPPVLNQEIKNEKDPGERSCDDSVNDEEDKNNDEGEEEIVDLSDVDARYNIHDFINKPPDGGFWAWTTAVCVMVINAFSWGSNSAYGVYLNHYTATNYFPSANMEEYVVIGGLCLGLSFMLCTCANTLVQRWNYKIIMLCGVAFIFIGFWLASIAKTITQLIMFQGLLLSIGYALAAGACFVIIPMWFLKHRSVAQGIASAGAGLGGLVFSRPVQVIIEKYGDNGVKWALRMQGLVCGFMLVLAIMLMKICRPLIDPKLGTKEKPLWKQLTAFLFRWDLYKQLPMACLLLWNMIYGVGYAILLFSFSSYATAIGLTYYQGSDVTTVQSVAQFVGRPLLGIFSDRVGRINSTILFTTILSILVFAWWIFIKNYAELIVFAFIAGFIMGINWVNFGPMTADYCGGGSQDSMDGLSMLTFSGGIPLVVAELIGLELRKPEMSKPFLYCQILVGAACLVSAIVLLPFREWKVKRVLQAEWDTKEDQRERLNRLLEPTWKAYLIRMIYPICV